MTSVQGSIDAAEGTVDATVVESSVTEPGSIIDHLPEALQGPALLTGVIAAGAGLVAVRGAVRISESVGNRISNLRSSVADLSESLGTLREAVTPDTDRSKAPESWARRIARHTPLISRAVFHQEMWESTR